MTLGERIAAIRNDTIRHKTMSQTEFGEMLGLTRNEVNNLEHDRNKKPSEAVLKLICRTFQVNPDWLYEEKLPMYLDRDVFDRSQEVRDIMKGESPLAIAVMASLASMPKEWWETWSNRLHEEIERQKK